MTGRKIAILLLCALWIAGGVNVFAWDDHDQLTQYALMEEDWAKDSVIAESLEDFLSSEKVSLVDVLQYMEKEAHAQLPYSPALPAALQFNPVLAGPELVTSFLHAIRVNPGYGFMLFVQPRAYEPRPTDKKDLDTKLVDVFNNRFVNSPFFVVEKGNAIQVLDVVASASDEPDYGMDLGLYEDNGTDYGKLYGFGIQSWGNPALIYGSQAPVHMAFPWEDPIIKAAAPWTGQSLVAYRVHCFTSLARFAFQSGHPYWGYRFAGIALHYLQDLAQPYHASLYPGKSALALLALNMFGSKAQKDAAVTLLSNRHLAFEDYVYDILAGNEDPALADRIKTALRSSKSTVEYRALFCYDVIAWQAYWASSKLDALIQKNFPAHIVNDPSYDYGSDPNRPWKELFAMVKKQGKTAELDKFAETQLGLVGAYTRAYLNATRFVKEIKVRNHPADSRSFLYVVFSLLVVAAVVFLVLLQVKRRKLHRSAKS